MLLFPVFASIIGRPWNANGCCARGGGGDGERRKRRRGVSDFLFQILIN